jgi:hypothetical protein
MIHRHTYKFQRGGVNQISTKEQILFNPNELKEEQDYDYKFERMEVLKPKKRESKKSSRFQKD